METLHKADPCGPYCDEDAIIDALENGPTVHAPYAGGKPSKGTPKDKRIKKNKKR